MVVVQQPCRKQPYHRLPYRKQTPSGDLKLSAEDWLNLPTISTHRTTCYWVLTSMMLLSDRNVLSLSPRSSRQVVVKEPVSITFPPTKEPVVGLGATSAPGEVTDDPLDEYYEEYDTADLPPLDLDFPDSGLSPVRPVPSSGQAAPPQVGTYHRHIS